MKKILLNKHKIITLLIFCFTISGYAQTTSPKEIGTANYWLKKGDNLYIAEQYDEAYECYRQAKNMGAKGADAKIDKARVAKIEKLTKTLEEANKNRREAISFLLTIEAKNEIDLTKKLNLYERANHYFKGNEEVYKFFYDSLIYTDEIPYFKKIEVQFPLSDSLNKIFVETDNITKFSQLNNGDMKDTSLSISNSKDSLFLKSLLMYGKNMTNYNTGFSEQGKSIYLSDDNGGVIILNKSDNKFLTLNHTLETIGSSIHYFSNFYQKVRFYQNDRIAVTFSSESHKDTGEDERGVLKYWEILKPNFKIEIPANSKYDLKIAENGNFAYFKNANGTFDIWNFDSGYKSIEKNIPISKSNFKTKLLSQDKLPYNLNCLAKNSDWYLLGKSRIENESSTDYGSDVFLWRSELQNPIRIYSTNGVLLDTKFSNNGENIVISDESQIFIIKTPEFLINWIRLNTFPLSRIAYKDKYNIDIYESDEPREKQKSIQNKK